MQNDRDIHSSLLLVSATLCKRELVRFLRQKSRIAGVIGSPLLFWFLIGSGLSGSFRHPGAGVEMNYLEYFFPGTIVLVLLFTSIFSTISVIEDRREGFLQSVLVAPVSRASIALGKISGGAILATVQGVLMMILIPVIGIPVTVSSFFATAAIIFTISFGLTGLGFMIAWKMESTAGFHAIMNLFLIPLWLLSGALFPPSGASGWLSALMRFNPLSYGMTALRYSLYLGSPSIPGEPVTFGIALLIMVLFSVGMFAASSVMVRQNDGVPA